MKLSHLSRPLFAALCGFAIAALPDATRAQERTRDDRPADGQRPPRGEFKPGDNQRGEPRDGGSRREEARPQGNPQGNPRGEGLPGVGQSGDFRPNENQRGPGNPQFNPQELFRDLNDEQRATLRGFFEANQGSGEKMMRLRREISESALADKPNEGLIRDKIMEAARLEADATVARVRAFAQVREKLPKETVERLRGMIASMGPRPGMQGPVQGGQGGPDVRREGGDVRRPAGDNFNQPGRGAPDGQFRKPVGEGDRRPEATERKPRVDGDRGPRPDGDRAPRPDGDRGRNPEGGDRKPELPRRPPTDQ